jgi:hypothetical protein
VPLPPGINVPLDTLLLPLALRSAGTYTSASFVELPIADIELWVCVTAVTGSATLDVSMETSPDGTTWTPVLGSHIAPMSAVGSTVANAPLPVTELSRMTSTVTGAGSLTYRVLAVAVVIDQ